MVWSISHASFNQRDTVDAIGTALVTPLVKTYPATVEDMRRWLRSDKIWLVRAAIQHQRGLKKDTHVNRVVEFCKAQVNEKEFFVAKAIGWALRDLAKIDPKSVRKFVDENPGMSAVARREAEKGLARTGGAAKRKPRKKGTTPRKPESYSDDDDE
jgi:3-methyladenine DNA glycosylase AlkD